MTRAGNEAAGGVLDLLERALSLAEEERRPFLRREVSPAQLDAVLAMLDIAEQATAIMPTGAMRPTLRAAVDRIGEQLGPYRIRDTLGQGGMGEVYLAERNDGIVNQEVAIKVIGGAALGERARRQFQVERQILADLQHPCITTLLDGGTTADGLPYVVMERVPGTTLERFLTQHAPSFEARLKLFLAIADGVAYAHRHLIVHGDLKPSNILVTGDGQPKLLDFGIARSLAPSDGDADSGLTGLMTPSYASPEQARGEPLTVASDVYALGLVLYECLTGQRFHDMSSLTPAQTQERLSTVPAPLASQVAGATDPAAARRLKGDLDAIIRRALAIDPTRRYASVTALSDDLQRYLTGYPIHARDATWRYRAGRFCRRNWIGVSAAAVIALSLTAATVISTIQAGVARTQRDIATREAATAEDAVEFLQSMLFSANPWEGERNETTIEDVLDYAEGAIADAFVERPESRVYLLSALGEVFIGRGDMDKGLDYARQAVALAATAPDVSSLRQAAAQRALGRAALEQHDLDTAIAAYLAGLRILDGAAEPAPEFYASLLNNLGATYNESGDFARAEASYRQALTLHRSAALDDPEGYSSTLSNLSLLLVNRGELTEGDRLLEESIRYLAASAAGDAKHGIALGNRAGLLVRMNRLDEAETLYQEAVKRLQRSLGESHPDTLMMMTSVGYYFLVTEQFDTGAGIMGQVLSRADGVLEPGHPLTAYIENVAGALYCHSGDVERGRTLLQASMDTRRDLYGSDHWSVGSSMSLLGECLLLGGDRDAAVPLLAQGHAAIAAALGPDDERTRIAARRLLDL
ncbi:MAG: protein kinase [Pseudomonadales bacterium]